MNEPKVVIIQEECAKWKIEEDAKAREAKDVTDAAIHDAYSRAYGLIAKYLKEAIEGS